MLVYPLKSCGMQATRPAAWLLILCKRYFNFLTLKNVSECGQASLSTPFQPPRFCAQFRGTGIPSAVVKAVVQTVFTEIIVHNNTMEAVTRTK